MKTNTDLEQEVQTKDVLLGKAKMIVFMLILGLVAAALLGGLGSYTKPLVEKNKELRTMQKVLESINVDYSSDNLTKVFKEKIKVVNKGKYKFYKTKEGKVAFKFEGEGIWAPIIGFAALDSNMETLEGISIMSQGETPGLGGRITEDWFLNQFKGLKRNPKIVVLKASKTADDPNEVDGIAGATLSGKALQKILNKNIEVALQKMEVN